MNDSITQCFLDDFSGGNVISIQAFRLLVGDLISYFHIQNEAVLRLLATFFEMEKPLAKKALEVYTDFTDQAKRTTAFFDIANRMALELGLKIPQFKHAPASLATALAEHLTGPNFEEQRLIYKERRAQQATKLGKKSKSKSDLKRMYFCVLLPDIMSHDEIAGSKSDLNLVSETIAKTARDSSASASAEHLTGTKDKDATNLGKDAAKKSLAVKADPVLIDFFSSIDDQVSAFENDYNSNQVGYNDDVGSFWYPSGQGYEDQYNEASNNQNQLLQQQQATEQMFANAGYTLNPNAAVQGYPPPLSNQSSFAFDTPSHTGGYGQPVVQAQNSSLHPSYSATSQGGFANNPFELQSQPAPVAQQFNNSQFNPFSAPAPAAPIAQAGISNGFNTAPRPVSSNSATTAFNPFGGPAAPVAYSQPQQQMNAFSAQPVSNKAPQNNAFTVDNVFGNNFGAPAQPAQPQAWNMPQQTAKQQPAFAPAPKNAGLSDDVFGDLNALSSGFSGLSTNPTPQPAAPQQQYSQNAFAQPPQRTNQGPQYGGFGNVSVQSSDPFNPFGTAPAQQQPQQSQAAFNPFAGLDAFGSSQRPQQASGSSPQPGASKASSISPNYVAVQGTGPFNPQNQPRSNPAGPFDLFSAPPATQQPFQQVQQQQQQQVVNPFGFQNPPTNQQGYSSAYQPAYGQK